MRWNCDIDNALHFTVHGNIDIGSLVRGTESAVLDMTGQKEKIGGTLTATSHDGKMRVTVGKLPAEWRRVDLATAAIALGTCDDMALKKALDAAGLSAVSRKDVAELRDRMLQEAELPDNGGET